MERNTSIESARRIMGDNFLGPDELSSIANDLMISKIKDNSDIIRPIQFSEETLSRHAKDYALIMAVPYLKDNEPITINRLRNIFGLDPDRQEPCFYNQDWYLHETFAETKSLTPGWYLLSTSIKTESRGKPPEILMSMIPKSCQLPSAILCTYAFFCYYLHTGGTMLWKNDYVWCSDFDHNGDRIYVGRYNDPEKKNKNGFSVHRHLTIRNLYGLAEEIIPNQQ